MQDIFTILQRAKEELKNRCDINKKVLFDVLARNNVKSVFVYFDGSNDGGCIETIELNPEVVSPLLEEIAVGFVWEEFPYSESVKIVDVNLKESIETMCYDFLRLKYDGWENGYGSYGNFDFDVENRKIKIELNRRSISEYSDEL